MEHKPTEQQRAQISFIGKALGPFFLHDPKESAIHLAFFAIRDADAGSAGAEWPLVTDNEASTCLSLMRTGIGDSFPTEDVIWEYRRLFIGPGKKPAPPWGSVYTDWEGVVFGETTLALRQWMREQGITHQTDTKTPEDHIGLMLLLMAWIAENKPDALNDYLSTYFLTWSSHYLEQLETAANHEFYVGLARLTRLSLEGMAQELRLDITYPKFFR